MSKSLRMLLLSMLVVAVAAMPAMAATFDWTGAKDNKWTNAANWTLSGDATTDYPGKNESSSYDVTISTDAEIEVGTYIANTVGSITISKAANVSISFTTDGRFATMPSISVTSGELQLNGTTARALGAATTWSAADNSKLTLNLPVTLSSTSALTLSVDSGAALTINEASLLNFTTIKADGSSTTVYLNAQPAAAASGKRLSFDLTDSAVLNISNDITLYANYDTSSTASYPVFAEEATLVKAGAGTLTLSRTNTTSYDVPVAEGVTVTVNAGTLVLGSKGIAESETTITVASGASLDVAAANAVNTTDQVELKVSGNATIANAGIGTATSLYKSNVFSVVSFDLSADVSSGGKLIFTGIQPLTHLSGAGTVVVSGTDAELILKEDYDSISGFTGTLEASTIGLTSSFGDMPFANAASSSIETIRVYGSAELTLDEAKLADVSGMDALTVHLYSNRNLVTDAHLAANIVGSLKASGDVTIGTLRVDGSRNADGVAVVSFNASSDVLTVNSLELHANKPLDSSTAPTYSSVEAIIIDGENVNGGKLYAKAIKNFTSDSGLGSDTAITVKSATLKIANDIPEDNGLVLENATLDAANGVTIPGDLTLSGDNTLKIVVTGDNMKSSGGGDNALNVGNNFTLSGNMSFDIDLQDKNQSLGNKYRLFGVADTSNGVTYSEFSMSVTGTLKDGMDLRSDDYGVYGYLTHLALQPRVLVDGTEITKDDSASWNVSMLGTDDFEAKISYDIPEGVEPAALINLISVDITVDGTAFQKSTVINDKVYFSTLRVNSPDKEIVLAGKLYADEVNTTVTLGWSKTGTAATLWATYENTGILYKGQEVVSTDFKNADTLSLVISRPSTKSDDQKSGTLSEDATADPEEIVIEAETPEITAGSGDVVLTIEGIREAVVANTSAKPVLVGNTYVWMNGFDNTTKYEMLYNGNWILMESLDIRIDGVSVNSASVDIEGGSDSITVTIPAALFNTETTVPIFQNVTIVGTTPDGYTLTAGPASVHIVPDYEEGTVNEGMGDIRYTTKDLPKSPIIVDGILDLTGPFSFDMTVNGSTETPSWFTWNVNSADGTIAYEVAEGAEAGTYEMRVIAYTAEGGYKYNFKLTITEGFKINNPDEPYGTIGGLNYEGRFTAENVPAGARVEWIFPTNIAWLKSAESGDVFVVYGHLPGHVDDEEAENDPNEYTYRVMATVSGDTVSKDWTITIEEDTDAEATIEYSDFTAGEITPSGDIETANSSYSVAIAFAEDYYDTEIEFLSLPYWLKATPVTATVDDAEVITGYTITYKEGTAVTAGETGVVRFEDPNDGGIVNWNVIFNETIQPEPGPGPAPQSVDLKLTTASSVTLTLGTAAGATSTLALEAENAIGTVSYTYTITPNNGGLTVSISGSRATLTGSTAGTYTVVFTATDDGRAAPNNTATFTTTVTVGGGVLPPTTSRDLTLGVSASSVSMNLGTQGGNTRTVTLTTTNASGDVTYTSTVSPDNGGLTVAISGDVATLTATTAGTYTVTFTATDEAARTATAATTVTVTSGVTPPTPGGSEDVKQFSVTASRPTITVEPGDVETFTLSTTNALGTVSYSSNQVWATVSGNTVTVTAPETEGTYSVTITATDSGRSTDSGNTASVTVTVIVAYDTTTANVGSSGGGCDAGFGAMALALALPLFLRRRRS